MRGSPVEGAVEGGFAAAARCCLLSGFFVVTNVGGCLHVGFSLGISWAFRVTHFDR